MDREGIVKLISEAVKDFAVSPDNIAVDEHTHLLGSSGVLDSMGLVNVVLDVEQQVNDFLGLNIVLANERAMSQKQSPFRTIGTLADYVLFCIQENSLQ
jgi:D-alanine--poly(phosphoribitol) ligase subunit 2